MSSQMVYSGIAEERYYAALRELALEVGAVFDAVEAVGNPTPIRSITEVLDHLRPWLENVERANAASTAELSKLLGGDELSPTRFRHDPQPARQEAQP